jgi:hypothetical protein
VLVAMPIFAYGQRNLIPGQRTIHLIITLGIMRVNTATGALRDSTSFGNLTYERVLYFFYNVQLLHPTHRHHEEHAQARSIPWSMDRRNEGVIRWLSHLLMSSGVRKPATRKR